MAVGADDMDAAGAKTIIGKIAAEDRRVGTATAEQNIVAGSADQDVVSATAIDQIVTRAAGKGVAAATASQDIGARGAGEVYRRWGKWCFSIRFVHHRRGCAAAAAAAGVNKAALGGENETGRLQARGGELGRVEGCRDLEAGAGGGGAIRAATGGFEIGLLSQFLFRWFLLVKAFLLLVPIAFVEEELRARQQVHPDTERTVKVTFRNCHRNARRVVGGSDGQTLTGCNILTACGILHEAEAIVEIDVQLFAKDAAENCAADADGRQRRVDREVVRIRMADLAGDEDESTLQHRQAGGA